MPARPFPSAALPGVVLVGAIEVVAAGALAAVLAPAGAWQPWIVLPLLVLVGGLSVVAVRRVRFPALAPGAAVGYAVATLGYAGYVLATRGEQVLPRRDAGSYLLSAQLLADTGRRIVPAGLPPELLSVPDTTWGSPAFSAVGAGAHAVIEPQFVLAPAATYSVAGWLGGGWQESFLPFAAIAAGTTALALLGGGLLLGRFLGHWWGVAFVPLAGLVFPVLHTARMTYSENLALLVLAAAFLALTVAAESAPMAWLAGLLLGAGSLVRVDFLRETMLVLPVLALMAARGARWVRRVGLGIALGTGYAAAAALTLSRLYVTEIAGSVVPLLGLATALAGASWWVTRRPAGRLVRWAREHARDLSLGLAAATVLTGLVLTSRPLWWVGRQSARAASSYVVAGIQQREGLPIDGTRTYAEQSVTWLAWWVGPLALAVALGVLAVLVARATRIALDPQREVPGWLAPLLVVAGSTVLTLVRPGITPDHPWADRRLLIPLLAVVALVLVAGSALARAPWAVRPRVGVAALVVASLAVPVGIASWPHAAERVEAGSAALVGSVCAAVDRAGVPADAVVLAVDARAANEWPPLLRDSCGRGVLAVTSAARRNPFRVRMAVETVRRLAGEQGRPVVLVATSAQVLTDLGVAGPQELVSGSVDEDPRLLVHRPERLVPLPISLWAGSPH